MEGRTMTGDWWARGLKISLRRNRGVLPSKYPAKGAALRRRRSKVHGVLALAALALLLGDALAASVPRLEIPRVERPPALEDFEGMRPGSEVAKRMAKVEGFLQRVPTDGAPVSERTEVYLGYDQQHLYAVFVCFDREPGKIRARMSTRNEIFSDDFVTIQLDTFRDQRRAYVFGANPLGIQGDAIWVEGVGFDQSFDAVFDTRGKLTAEGYVVWIRVPFKSMRFPASPRQTWGILLTRDIPRGSEESFWPQYTLRLEGRLHQMATLEGLENVSPGRNIQIQPYGVFRGFSRELDLREPSSPSFTSRAAQGDGGVDAKFVLKDALVLDVTVNPDFSQVESDQPQVTTNQRFELFFPEKRPFFLENGSYFDTPIPLLFTRRIADPQFGVRLTGKLGKWSVGALAADDQSPGKLAAPGSAFSGERAFFGVLRVNRDLWAQSSLGMIYTDRELAGGFNRVGGLDGRFKLHPNWVTGFQAVASSTRFPDGTQIGGPAWDFFLRGNGRHFLYDFTFDDRSRNFRTDAGFVPRTDIRHLAQTTEYWFRPEGTVTAWGPRLFAETILDHQGTMLFWAAIPRVTWNFSRQTSLRLSYAFGGERLRPQDFPGLTRDLYHPIANGGIVFETSFFSWLSVRAFSTIAGTGINFVPASGQLPDLENQYVGDFGVTLRPTTRLVIDNSYLVTRFTRRQGGENIFNNHILRSRWNYQFTPRLSARLIAQYDAVLASPSFTSLPTRKNFNADFLITYLVHPGTAVFVGYNSNVQNLDRSLTVTPDGLLRTRNRFLNDGRQFFVKVSYQFRF